MKTSSRKTKLVATSAEQTRESYIAAVEPICKVNTQANEKTLNGVRQKIRKGQLKVAAGQFTKAAGAFSKAVTQINAQGARLARAAATALMRALAANVLPVSSGSGRPSSPADCVAMP